MDRLNKIPSLNAVSLATILIAGLIGFNGCKKNSIEPTQPFQKPPQTGKIYMPQAQYNPVFIKLTKALSDTTVEYSANVGVGGKAKSDITVNFNVTPSLVNTYNAAHSTSLILLPKDNYTLSGKTLTIHKGDKKGSMLTLKITTGQPELQPAQNYILPVTVSTNTEGIGVNEKWQTTYFVIQNKIALSGEGVKPEGKGTKAAPYKIANLPNLKWVSKNPSSWGATFIQTKDIDAIKTQNWNNSKGFNPIGRQADTSFTGTYDGQGHTIKNLYIDRTQLKFVGFFGFFGKDDTTATVKNLHLTEINITGGGDTGGLIGINYGMVDGCEVSSSQGHVNGATGVDNIGGLIGSSHGIVKNSQANVDVNGGGAHVGGLIGFSDVNSITKDSHATGDVKSSDTETGGLTGDNHGLIDNCYATGNVQNNNDVQYAGGLVGINYGPVKNSYATGDVTGGGNDGGLIGDNHALVSHSHSTGDVVANGHSNGGLIGYSVGPIEYCYATGNTQTTGSGGQTGGLVGYAKGDGTIEYSFATGNSTTPAQNAGGLVGDTHTDVSNCYATGNSTGANDVGGLVGYSTGDIKNSYSTGKPNATSDKHKNGGLIGKTTGTVENSYWDKETSGQSDGFGVSLVGGVTGLKTSEMQGSNAETNMKGFDFSKVWQTNSGDYPTLRDNQPPPQKHT